MASLSKLNILMAISLGEDFTSYTQFRYLETVQISEYFIPLFLAYLRCCENIIKMAPICH